MKTCFKCNQSKSLDAFYHHAKMSDGRLGKCKKCAKKDTALNTAKKEKDPSWVISERKRQREKERKRRDLGLTKTYKTKTRPKRVANQQLSNAIASGKVKPQSCAVCGKKKTQGHHEDYSKGLDVVWLCVRHHNDRHIHLRNRTTLNQPSATISQWIKTAKLLTLKGVTS